MSSNPPNDNQTNNSAGAPPPPPSGGNSSAPVSNNNPGRVITQKDVDQTNNSAGAHPPPPSGGNSSAPVSNNNPGRVITQKDVDLVHNLIERCILLNMNKDETMEYLSNRAKTEPIFTKLVWEKLEEDNPEFFRAYYVRLAVMNQIKAFNKLLELQALLMNSQNMNIPLPDAIQDANHPNLTIPQLGSPEILSSSSEITFEPTSPKTPRTKLALDLDLNQTPKTSPGEISSRNKSPNSANVTPEKATPGDKASAGGAQ